MARRSAAYRTGSYAGVTLAFLGALAPAAGFCTSHREADTQQELRNAALVRSKQLVARQEAADRATLAAAEMLRLAHERVEAAMNLRQAEAVTADLAARIDELAQRRREAEQRLETRAKALQPLLPIIERLSLYPAETLLAVPESPDSALRGLLILRGLSRQMEIETKALRADKAEMDGTTDALRQEAPRLAEAEAVQKHKANILDLQIAAAHSQQAIAEAQASEAASRVAGAAARMETLRSALAALEAQRHADQAKAQEEANRAERQRNVTETQSAREQEIGAAHPASANTITSDACPHGQLQPPVIGVVAQGGGEQTGGDPATGVSYYAPPRAVVISPCGGRVVFGENFRSYGLLLIIDCGGGYHIVLSGLARLDVKLGQRLVVGEPVGVMPTWIPGSTMHRPALHVELRHDGTAVNPALWLRSTSYTTSSTAVP